MLGLLVRCTGLLACCAGLLVGGEVRDRARVAGFARRDALWAARMIVRVQMRRDRSRLKGGSHIYCLCSGPAKLTA